MTLYCFVCDRCVTIIRDVPSLFPFIQLHTVYARYLPITVVFFFKQKTAYEM